MRHGVAAWVADELAAAGQPVPADLQQAARAQLAAGLKIKRLTLTVVDTLAAVEVVPVLLKGYGLASRLYPDQPLARPATDVDVLLAGREVPRAEQALAKLGLAHREVPGVEQELEEHHHRAWAGPAGLVEVHFRLFSGFGGRAFDDQAIQARTVAGTLDGRPVRWLGPEDELVYLATHAANHGFLRLSWLVDLRRFLALHPALDWVAMLGRAREAGFEVPLVSALLLTHRLLDVPLPVEVERATARHRLRRRLDRWVFSPERVADARWSNDRLASFLLRLYLTDSPGQGARHLWDGALRLWRQRRGADAEV